MRKYVFLLLAFMTLCSCSENKKVEQKAPLRVKTQVVSHGFANNSYSYVGIIEEREATAVSFTGMGVVRRVLVSEGQAVSRGQLLAEMDDTQARNLLSGAEAAMSQANDALQRYQMLHDNGSLPEVQWVEIQSKVAQAKSQLEVAKKNLSDCRLVSPVSGIIGKKLVGAGETAMPSQAIVTILDISTVKVKVSVPEGDISNIDGSTPSTITVEAVGAEVQGGRIEKGVEADALTHTYDVRINVSNGDRRLLPGMVASVSLTHNPIPADAPTRSLSPRGEGSNYALPVTAVQKAADGSLFVWTVSDDSTVHRTKVTIGDTTGNNVAIIDGLDMGQRVVTEGYQKLSEGTRVIY